MAPDLPVEMTTTDALRIDDYRKLACVVIARYGGRFLVRGARSQTCDGDWHPQRPAMLGLLGGGKAKRWRISPEHRAACEIRDRAATTRIVAVEGSA